MNLGSHALLCKCLWPFEFLGSYNNVWGLDWWFINYIYGKDFSKGCVFLYCAFVLVIKCQHKSHKKETRNLLKVFIYGGKFWKYFYTHFFMRKQLIFFSKLIAVTSLGDHIVWCSIPESQFLGVIFLGVTLLGVNFQSGNVTWCNFPLLTSLRIMSVLVPKLP